MHKGSSLSLTPLMEYSIKELGYGGEGNQFSCWVSHVA